MAERTIKIRFDGSARGLERAANKAARQIDQFGDRADKAFARAGSSGGKSFLDNFTNKLDNAANVAASLGSGIARAFQSNPFIASAIAAALLSTLALAMPAVGAAAGAALVGGFGAAIAGIGIAAAAQTDKVQAAFDDLVSDVTNTLAGLAAPLEGVIERALQGMRKVVDFFAPALADAFQSMAPHLDRFISNVFAAMRQLRPAVQPVTEAFNALLDAVGGVLPGLMSSIGDIIADIARTISNNAQAFAKLVKILGGIALLALQVVRGLTKMWTEFSKVIDVGVAFTAISAPVGMALMNMDKKSTGLGKAQSKTARSIKNVTTSLQKQVEQLRKATNPVFALTSAIQQVDQAQKAYNDAVDKYGPESEQARSASVRLAQAVANVEAAAKDGDLSFDAFKEKLHQWVRQGKITEEQADDIAARVRQAKKAAEDYAGSYNASLTLTVDQRTLGAGAGLGRVVVGARAEGGPVRGGSSYLVGEEGPELFTPKQSGRIVSNQDLGGGSSTGGGSTGHGGINVEHLEIKAFSDRFSLRQVEDQLAMRGVV